MKRSLLASLLGAAGLIVPLHSIGATIGATYRPAAGNHWTADFVVTGDGSPSVINDFTVFFPDSSFAALAVGASAANWDSLVVQPDVTLHSPGFFDSLALGSGIASGVSLGGFEVTFDYLGSGNPPALRFDINDANFHPIFSGLTTTTVAAIPEPESALLIALGLGAIAGVRVRRQGRNVQTGSAA